MKKFKLTAVLLAAAVMALISVSLTSTVFAADEHDEALVSLTADVQGSGAEQTAEISEDSENSLKKTKAIAAALVVGVAAAAGAVSMAMAIKKSTESMARQPEAADKINSAMMLGLVFIETAIIYALIVAILVIFVL